MANVDHPCFRQPENKNLRLWRYMDFTKFVSLIATKKLFFCRSDRFDDPFEGSYSKANVVTVGEPISILKADLSARDFPRSLCSEKLYMR